MVYTASVKRGSTFARYPCVSLTASGDAVMEEAESAANAGGLAKVADAVARMGSYVDGLRERIRLLEAVVENFPGGISLYDRDMRMVLCNERQKEMLDYPKALFADGFPSLEALFTFNARRGEYGPGDWREQVARRMALLAERKPHCYERERPNGRVMEIRGVPIDGGGFVTTYFDVTEQRQTQELVQHMALHDTLTDLPNRALFGDRLKTALALAKRQGLMAVHYVDMDNFKPVNDRHGHKAGDGLLVDVARRLRGAVRDNDTVARLGGDEFAIVQTGIHERRDAEALASRVIAHLSRPFDFEGKRLEVGASIGIALAPEDGVGCDEILAKADTALYRSKSGGRGRYTFFSQGEAA
jgi:diguanylate cyclase (GGDEF)-like protein